MNRGSSKYRIWIYLMAVAGAIVAVLFCYQFMFRFPIWTLRAFKVPSRSMCPTICSGERIVVQIQNEKSYIPKRCDVIAFDYGADRSKFIKRVIGLPGDVVAPGPNDTILVNGQPWQPPPICAKSLLPAEPNRDNSAYSGFRETHVPPGEVFVIGDNLYDSLDSRIDQFEHVTIDKIFGKPVMIYWSPDSARIGCSIK